MKLSSVGHWSTLAAIAATLLIFPALAQETPGDGAKTPPAAPETKRDPAEKSNAPQAKPSQTPAPATGATGECSPGVSETLKLVQAGVSKDIIRSYIEQSPTAYQLKAADVLALKENSVPDELILAMIKRGAELRAQAGRPPGVVAPAQTPTRVVIRTPAYGGLDPESYDFWWYHYAYPRALAAANQRLLSGGVPYYGFSYYPYGFYQPMPIYPRWGTVPQAGVLRQP